MIVEFVGCSGAGKTTQIDRALQGLAARGRTAGASTALTARATRTAWIKNESVRNICLDFLLLPWLMIALRRNGRFFFFGLREIARRGGGVVGFLQRSLSQVRNLSANELLRRLRFAPEFILVDEGTIGGVHNVLVQLRRRPDARAIEAFSRLVPKPDLVLHIDTPVEVALRRTASRPDPPLRFHSLTDRLRFVRLGHEAHRALGQCEALRSCWYTIPADAAAQESIVDLILAKEMEEP